MVGKSILLLTGDSALQGFFQTNVVGAGYRLTTVQTFREELRSVLEADAPDLIVADIRMPFMDGIETSLCIRRWFDVPIIMLSAWGAGKDRVRRLDLSAEDYLTDPMDWSELQSHLETAFRANEGCECARLDVGAVAR